MRNEALDVIAQGRVKTAKTVFEKVWKDVGELSKQDYHDKTVARLMAALETGIENAKLDGIKYKGVADLIDDLAEKLPSKG